MFYNTIYIITHWGVWIVIALGAVETYMAIRRWRLS
jgi:hypothetical protein